MPSAPEAPRSAWRIRPIGDDLLCITTNDPGASQHVARHLRAGGPWREVVAGIDSVVVGPGSIMQAHKPDEFIAVSELAATSRFIDRLIDHCKAE